ncbi:MAG TPA: glycosyltransferase, partial [Solirubrobacteraceae bacterium]|nr:glycosyltransferase [Solirubrobacteraceae bacterium]
LHPGTLPAGELAGWVAAADLALLPFVDGVSTRRSTVVAALQHGVCVLSTDGRMTDHELRETAALVLTAADDAAAFACAAARLGVDPRLRARHATAARQRFERRHAWPVVARRLLEALGLRQ